MSLQAIANRLRVDRPTLNRMVKEAQQENSPLLVEGVHYQLVKKKVRSKVMVLNQSAFMQAYRLYTACRTSQNGVTVTEFCRIKRINAATTKKFIDENQSQLVSRDVVARSSRGWRILRPDVLLEVMPLDSL